MKLKKIVLLAFVLVLLSTAMIGRLMRPVEASGTITIKADGSIDPPDAPINTTDMVTYYFTGNINDSIVIEKDDIVVDGAGYTLQGTGNGTGIYLSYRSNVTIKNMEINWFDDGIYLSRSSNNSIFGNNITNNNDGVTLGHSSNNTISGNNITNNEYGIYDYMSGRDTVSGNNITNNECGIYECGSGEDTVSGNNITNKDYGIRFFYSSNISIFGNNITNNDYGIYLDDHSSNNSVYHNNFINNTQQVCIETSGYANFWDDGVGKGNYWSDYEERYPNATEIDGSGIWDIPYEIGENNVDNYPIVPEFPTWTSMLLILITLTVSIVIYRRRLLKTPTH